ncbi:MAG: NAD-dependent epimerase/dehydratase family protein [Gammaproteobacteria bacterium]|nr:NAD-dependent epimerase/dehydratase family protein [Gammaproteobacteria bacterium]
MAVVVATNGFREHPMLVTGGTGFIGRRLVAALLERGAWVRVLVRNRRKMESKAWKADRFAWNPDVVESAIGDLSDPLSLERACSGVKTVFHLAGFAHADIGSAVELATRHWSVNAEGTFQLLDAARATGVGRFVFLSTVKAVGDPGAQCVDEDWDALPETPYGRAKRAAEERALAVGRASGMHTVNLRPALVYGPGMGANLWRLIEALRWGWLPPLPETENRRSLVHVDDVVQALLLAATHPEAAGRTYCVTDGRTYSGRELYVMIRQALHRSVPRWAVPEKVLWSMADLADDVCRLIGRRDRRMRVMLDKLLGWACYDSRRISQELGYRPVWDLPRALPELLREKIE